ncbi:MAG: hypothetical protein FWE38_03290 [Firmicutes bacterium]|nr:hypothetical protein [Bacillota bacterium]
MEKLRQFGKYVSFDRVNCSKEVSEASESLPDHDPHNPNDGSCYFCEAPGKHFGSGYRPDCGLAARGEKVGIGE